jgi:hypothetical protein
MSTPTSTRAALPCEYWLCEESATGPYSKLNVSALGLKANATISMNANTFGAGKTMPFPNGTLSKVPLTLRDFLEFNRSALKRIMTQRMLPKVVGGAATTNVVILDLEYPFQYVHPCQWGTLNASTLAAVVNATRLRIQVARELMPKAGVALYATVRGFDGCSGPGPMAGFQRAAALGVFDDLTHLVPVLYMGSKTDAPAAVAATLAATLTLRPRDNRTLPMVVLLSWMLVDGRREGCALEYPRLRNLLGAVAEFETANPGHVGAIALWSGSDDETSAPTKVCGKMDRQMSYYQWLYGAHIVPGGCMPHARLDGHLD